MPPKQSFTDVGSWPIVDGHGPRSGRFVFS